ncbi:hypothetical protein CF319_g6138 [Tilletia indica]|nr:hypothetical protein CF319_g6138 [Tilletia indica]
MTSSSNARTLPETIAPSIGNTPPSSWHLPLAAGVPPPFQQYMVGMAGATHHCGRMNASVSRLIEIVGFLDRFKPRHGSEIELTSGSHLLRDIRGYALHFFIDLDAGMQAEYERTRKELEEVQIRCHEEFQVL